MFMTKLSRLSKRAMRIGREEDGISAVEFALCAPFLALLYFGCVELSLMMQTDRRVTSAASTMGDLVARAAVMNEAEMDDVFEASRMIFDPAPVEKARLRISSLISSDGVVTVDWSQTSDTSDWEPHIPGTPMTVPENLIPAGGSVVFAEVEFDYESDIGFIIDSKRLLKDNFYLRPRRVNRIEWQDNN